MCVILVTHEAVHLIEIEIPLMLFKTINDSEFFYLKYLLPIAKYKGNVLESNKDLYCSNMFEPTV